MMNDTVDLPNICYHDVAGARILRLTGVVEDNVHFLVSSGPLAGVRLSMFKHQLEALVRAGSLVEVDGQADMEALVDATMSGDSPEMKRLAMFLAYFGVRNTKLEDIHSEVEGFSDTLMKDLMIDITDKLYSHLRLWEQLGSVVELEKNIAWLKVPDYWQVPERRPVTMLEVQLEMQGEWPVEDHFPTAKVTKRKVAKRKKAA